MSLATKGLAALVLVAGCNFMPAYSRPAAPVPQTFAGASPTGAGAPSAELHWQSTFTNPSLQAIVKQALANNRDVRIAALNVEKVQATYGIQRAALMPTVGVAASGERYRLPRKMSTTGSAMTVEQDVVQLGVLSWELDFFGRIRSLSEQARNQFLATEQARTWAQISLVATIAQQYVVYAADNENLRLAQSTFESQKAYGDLIGQSRALGIASELDLRQAQSQVETARVDVVRYRGLIALDLNALNLLVGSPVSPDLLPTSFDAAGELRDVSPGLSSQVLLERPDIRMAEYQLKAANANIGAARAAFFPAISLTGGIGTMSPQLSSLFGSGTGTWSFTPQISIPIFAGGALRAGLKVSEVSRDIAVLQYESAIQSAFREVSDGLVRRATLVEQLEVQRALLESLQATYMLSETRYQQGIDAYLSVLVAQRALYGAQQGLVATQLAHKTNQIALFKALAGQL